MRWYTVVEEEDVLIDDISAMIIEFANVVNVENKLVNRIEH